MNMKSAFAFSDLGPTAVQELVDAAPIVLRVEPDYDNRAMCAECLRVRGFDVSVVLDSDTALLAARVAARKRGDR
jgi:hypothetical protein